MQADLLVGCTTDRELRSFISNYLHSPCPEGFELIPEEPVHIIFFDYIGL